MALILPKKVLNLLLQVSYLKNLNLFGFFVDTIFSTFLYINSAFLMSGSDIKSETYKKKQIVI
jgi:hypothetical protein